MHRLRQRPLLRNIHRVGARLTLAGNPQLKSEGRITFGDDFHLSSRPVQSHIVALNGAEIVIGDRVFISYGAAITAQREIKIGNDTKIGPFVVIIDSDFHRPGDRNSAGEITPVVIGSDVTIGARVTILRSSFIGAGATILSGSMVSGNVPDGATVGGVPARLIQDQTFDDSIDVAELIRKVLSLAERPRPDSGPDDIVEWDSLGTLRLLLAIEDIYGITVREDQMQSARTVEALATMVRSARESAIAGA